MFTNVFAAARKETKPGGKFYSLGGIMNRKLGLLIYSLGHLLVDGACCLVMLTAALTGEGKPEELSLAIVLYNTVAFAIQPFFGLLADKIGRTNLIAAAGCILVGGSAVMLWIPFAAAVTAGLGNAMYHIGGGTYSLNMDRKKAVYPGIFVAPGAIGLFLGALLANHTAFRPIFVMLPMALLALGVLPVPHIACLYGADSGKQSKPIAGLSLLLLLLVILLRSVIGSVGEFPWKNTTSTALILTLMTALGKACGGLISDRLGRRHTTVIALLLSAPLLAFCESGLLPSLAGVFLFNLTMAVTVTEIADRLQGYSGFAFGLTTLALILGTYLIYMGWKDFFAQPWVTLALILLSAAMMFFSIREDGRILSKGEQS